MRNEKFYTVQFSLFLLLLRKRLRMNREVYFEFNTQSLNFLNIVYFPLPMLL